MRLHPFFFHIQYIALVLALAFGQPARSAVCSAASSFFLFGCFWFCLSKVQSNKKRKAYLFFGLLLIEGVRLSWMATSHYHGLGILAAYVFFVLIVAFQFSCFTHLIFKKKNFSYLTAAAMAGGWTWIEWSRLFFMCGYPFNPLGLSLAFTPVTMQISALFGVYGLTFFSVWMNLLVYKGLKEKKAAPWICCFLSITLLLAYGFNRTHSSQNQEGTIKIGLVQPGWTLEEKGYFYDPKTPALDPVEQMSLLIQMANKANKSKVKCLVFPEAILPFDAFEPVYDKMEIAAIFLKYFAEDKKEIESYLKKKEAKLSNLDCMKAIAFLLKSDVIVGLLYKDPADFKAFNTAFCVTQEGKVSCYHKRKLVPLGEYLPRIFPKKIAYFYGLYSFFSKGKEKKVLSGVKNYFPTICFEECFSDFTKIEQLSDVDLLVNLTNDIWFYPSALARQHLHHAKLRAVENGLPHVRACNSGITAVIDSSGYILEALDETDSSGKIYQGLLISDVPLKKKKALYPVWGDKAVLLFSFFFAFCFFCSKIFIKKESCIEGLSVN